MAKKSVDSDVWDGTERRVQVERRRRQAGPFQEFPKTVHGVVALNAEHEAEINSRYVAPKASDAPVKRKVFSMSAEDADGTAGRLAAPGDEVPGDLSAIHPGTASPRARMVADAPVTRAPRSARKK